MAKCIVRYIGNKNTVVDAAIEAAAGRPPDKTSFAYPSGPGGKLITVTIHEYSGTKESCAAIDKALEPLFGVEAFVE